MLMPTSLKQFLCGAAALLGAITVSYAQANPPASEPASSSPIAKTPATAPIPGDSSMMLVQATSGPAAPIATPATTAGSTTAAPATDTAVDNSGAVGVRE